MYIPHDGNIYGSNFKRLYIQKPEMNRSYAIDYLWNLGVTKTHLKNLDRPSQRCSSETDATKTTTTECISEFIYKELGCKIPIYGMVPMYTNAEICATSSFTRLKGIVRDMRLLEQSVYNASGCLGPCERNAYEISESYPPQTVVTKRLLGTENPDVLRLKVALRNGMYELKEQYVIYGPDSLIADVGGYMGLLLGCSLLGLCQSIGKWVQRHVIKMCARTQSLNALSSQQPNHN